MAVDVLHDVENLLLLYNNSLPWASLLKYGAIVLLFLATATVVGVHRRDEMLSFTSSGT